MGEVIENLSVRLDNPTIRAGNRVTHLSYRVVQ